MNLLQAMTTGDALTNNGALAHSTSSNFSVDLFFKINAMRSLPEEEILKAWIPAFSSSPLDAMKILFYSRDVREGQGERRVFRVILEFMAKNYPNILVKNLSLVPEYGTWEDLLVLNNTCLEKNMIALLSEQLKKDLAFLTQNKSISLAGKWAPSEKSKKWPGLAIKIMKHLGIKPKQYRGLLSRLRAALNVVETKMCSKQWNNITYSHVPSHAMKSYRRAFSKNDSERWKLYLDDIKCGKDKVNAKVLLPHDLVKLAISGECDEVIEQQWKSLPNYMANNKEILLPICDVSGSMEGLPMTVSIALGLYISERNKGQFKDAFLTFSERPTLQYVVGNSLKERVALLRSSDWGMNTSLEKVFSTILDKAVSSNVPKHEMPTMVLILSDMQFDKAISGSTLMDVIKTKYYNSGYTLPKVCFWNLSDVPGTVPVKFLDDGTALVSGFSPSILKSLVSGNEISPVAIMRAVLDSDRYVSVVN
jgi:hypothetical protein